MGGDGVAEELEDRLALQLEGLCHGQDPLDETEAFFAVTAEGNFPPKDQASQDPLGQVVGWCHPLPADKSPLRLLEPQHIGKGLGGLPLGTRQTHPQQAAEPSFQRMHPAAQLSPANPAFPVPVPQLKDLPIVAEASAPDPSPLAFPFRDTLQVPLQMDPAQLAKRSRDQRVGPPPVAAVNAPGLPAQQGLQSRFATVEADLEGHMLEAGHPSSPSRPSVRYTILP